MSLTADSPGGGTPSPPVIQTSQTSPDKCPMCFGKDLTTHCKKNRKCNWGRCVTCKAFGPVDELERWVRIEDDQALAS